ncbi:2Fe-2S iron-sulfur cluster binding domain-containing protein [Chromobacterium paludis]|uniref:2Fe-2S iron-sulfur cluster binding domain-containing protein n=1 Tax=Chromobacterium paludis TaxID=2605945 RepID=A0A5C1DPA7_9NEIS|nr:2Fe-2S iron-sulfur cluster binding domain-containing protein [Chromobacterium paludis]
MAIVKLASGRQFQVEKNTSLLEAASSSGLKLPYSCRTGRCSSCKAKVLSGITSPLMDETGLTSEERKEGWILTCARSAQSDVELDIEDFGDIVVPVPKTLPCRISLIEQLASDVVKVVLRIPPAENFKFIPGQYIDVIGPGGVRRSYSLANSSFVEKALELYIRKVDGGVMSEYWFNQAKVDDLLRLHGPHGTFWLRDTANIDVFFLATGTGIAPVKSMLESIMYLQPEKKPRSVTILWGGRQPQDFYLDVPSIFGGGNYIPVQSRSHECWTGKTGYIQHVMLDLVSDWDNASVYACGSDVMIHSAKKILTDAGLPAKQFYSDAFVCSASN